MNTLIYYRKYTQNLNLGLKVILLISVDKMAVKSSKS